MSTAVQVEMTVREREVARYSARGFTRQYIAKKLFISARTVDTHIARVYDKLQVSTKDELIERYAGWL